VGECFFCHRPTQVIPHKGPLNGRVRTLSRLSTDLELGLNVGNDEVHGKQEQHDAEAGEDGGTEDQVEENQGDNDLQWT